VKLDLHGVQHKDVERICHKFINTHWGSAQELHIVTGHSTKMIKLVSDVLKEYQVEYQIGDQKNSGFIKLWV